MSNKDPQKVDYRKVSAGQGWQWYVEGWRLFLTRPGVLYLVLILFLLVQLAISIVPLVGGIVATLIAPAMMAECIWCLIVSARFAATCRLIR